MKYKLAKELPFAEIGAEVKVDKNTGIITVCTPDPLVPRRFIGQNNFGFLIVNGWIEESHNEWYEIVHLDRTPEEQVNVARYHIQTYKEAKNWLKDNLGAAIRYKIIKVREVEE